jgi:hypothetical protein
MKIRAMLSLSLMLAASLLSVGCDTPAGGPAGKRTDVDVKVGGGEGVKVDVDRDGGTNRRTDVDVKAGPVDIDVKGKDGKVDVDVNTKP